MTTLLLFLSQLRRLLRTLSNCLPSRPAIGSVFRRGLRALGYYTGLIDGLAGPGTRAAILEWQRTQSGVATSYLDGAQTQVLMALGPVSTEATNGSTVVRDPPPASDPPAPTPSRVVVRAVPGSRISIDGEIAGTTDDNGNLLLDVVQLGRHVLVAEKTGYETVTRVIEVERGRSDVVELVLEPLPGRLSVTANVDGAFVAVDGGEMRALPLTGLQVPSGVRQVTVVRLGYELVVRTVEVPPGELATVDVGLEPVDVGGDIALVRRVFDAGNYRQAAELAQALVDILDQWAQTGLDVAGPLASVSQKTPVSGGDRRQCVAFWT